MTILTSKGRKAVGLALSATLMVFALESRALSQAHAEPPKAQASPQPSKERSSKEKRVQVPGITAAVKLDFKPGPALKSTDVQVITSGISVNYLGAWPADSGYMTDPTQEPSPGPSPGASASPLPSPAANSPKSAITAPESPFLNVSIPIAVPRTANAVYWGAIEKYAGRSGEIPADKVGFLLHVKVKGLRTKTGLHVVLIQGEAFQISMTIDLTTERPVVIAQPNCAEGGFQLEPFGDAAGPGIALLSCARTGLDWRLTLWSVPGRKWQAPNREWRTGENYQVLVRVLSDSAKDLADPLTIALYDDKAKVMSTFLLSRAALATSWFVTGSLGPTFVTYTETVPRAPTIELSQIGMTAKVQGLFAWKPGRIDAALSVFGTLFALGHSPDSVPSARWLGMNGRVAFLKALDQRRQNVLSIQPGFYSWSMFVAGNAYGVRSLNGPQLVVNWYRQLSAASIRMGAYVKFAMMAEGLALTSLTNRELAFGAYTGFRLGKIPRPFSAAVDISTLSFGRNGFSIQLNTYSVSLGYSLF